MYNLKIYNYNRFIKIFIPKGDFMKRGKILAIIFIIIFMAVLGNKVVENEYNINLIQYFTRSDGLTEDEEAWLQKHNVIVYGADQNSPPLRYVDNETKQYKGVSVDLIQALSIELGIEIKFKPLVFKDALDKLDEGQIDICDIFPSHERSKKFLFSDPIYNLRAVILVAHGENNIKSYSDLKDKKVAVIEDDYAIEYLNANVPGVKFIFTKDMENAIKLLVSGDADAVVGDEPVISYFIDNLRYKEKVTIIDTPLYERGVVIAVHKSEAKLLSIINKGVFGIKKKKVAEKIQQKWFGISAPISKDEISSRILINVGIIILIFLLIFYILYYWNKRLKEEVRRQTEELYVSRNDLQTTFDGVTYFMVVIDANCNIISVNKAFCNYVNINKEDIIKMKCNNFPGILYNDCGKCLVKDVFINGNERKKEIKYDERFFEVDTFPLEDKNKKIIKVLIAIKDITELRINAKRLLQSDKMAAVGQLAAGVAHEIRNPLGLIRNYTYVLKGQMKENSEKTDKCINVIESSVDRASNIIDNLLNFSRISGDSQEEVDIKEFVQNILNLERKMMEKYNIALELELKEEIICYINQEALKHILINLISNAIDAMPGGGILKIQCNKNEDKIYFIISDAGVGIKKEDLNNIFNPFFTTKAPGKGTGLGLYIAYNEVQKFGGEIKVVSSEINKGTTFKLVLPIKSYNTNG